MHEQDKKRIIASIEGTVYEFPTVQARDRFIVTEGWKNSGAAPMPDKNAFIDGLTITRQPDKAPVNQAPEKKPTKKWRTFGMILKAIRGDSPSERAPVFSAGIVMQLTAQAQKDQVRISGLQGEIASLQSACHEAQKINTELRRQIMASSLPIATPFTHECKPMPFTPTLSMTSAGRKVMGDAINKAIVENEPLYPDKMLVLIEEIYNAMVFVSPDYFGKSEGE
jgi:hypothetical protein